MSDWNKIGKWAKKGLEYSLGYGVIKDTVDYINDIKDHPEHVADRQNEAQKRAIDEQNEYNTPANQIQRLLDAGLNPNLAYGLVDTGNQRTTANYKTGDFAPVFEGLLGHAFNAVQILNNAYMREKQLEVEANARMSQEQYNRDVLEFQKNQASINNAFRAQELAFRQSHSDDEYYRRMYELDERIRHNRAQENRGSFWQHSYHLFDSAIRGMSGGQHADDSLTSTTHMMKKYAEKQLASYLDPTKSPFEKAYDLFFGNR